MRVRMFKPQFAPLVKAGTKRQTIRPTPKRMPKVGDCESWREWSGLPYRSPQTELAKVIITMVEEIEIGETADTYFLNLPNRPLRGALMPTADWTEIAVADGFKSTFEMCKWFEKQHGLPFKGILIKAK